MKDAIYLLSYISYHNQLKFQIIEGIIFSLQGFQGLSSARSLIGIKRLGELNVKPFRNACQQRFSSGEAEIKSVELSSLWQNHINDPQWHPFKFANIDGKLLVCLSFKYGT